MAFDMGKAVHGKASVSNLDKIRNIKLGFIDRNEANFYSIDGIAELAESIRTVGLLDPIRVVPVSGGKGQRYKIVSGHRRFEAYWSLLRETVSEKWETIPALVMEDLDDLTETFALITANATARELTYGEKCRQEQLLRETLEAMKAAGREVPKNLGQYLAEQLGTSRNEVSRMHSVNERLIPEARMKLDKGEMTAQQAYELSRKPEAEQQAAVKTKRLNILDECNLKSTVNPMQAVRSLVDGLLWELSGEVKHINSRTDGIATMKRVYGYSGFASSDNKYWFSGAYDNGRPSLSFRSDWAGESYYIPFSDLWDLLSIVCMQKVASNLDTGPSPAPAAQLWHREDPERNDDYVCMYRVENAVSVSVFQWRGGWQKFSQPVGDVYKIIQWTEVPEC